jgi:hypothetical protein
MVIMAPDRHSRWSLPGFQLLHCWYLQSPCLRFASLPGGFGDAGPGRRFLLLPASVPLHRPPPVPAPLQSASSGFQLLGNLLGMGPGTCISFTPASYPGHHHRVHFGGAEPPGHLPGLSARSCCQPHSHLLPLSASSISAASSSGWCRLPTRLLSPFPMALPRPWFLQQGV